MEVILKTNCGEIKGTGNEAYCTFLGVPFAQPPVGENRWLPPKKLESWDGILNATKYAKIAPQPSMKHDPLYTKEFYADESYDREQSEDCLYLNIWTPREIKDKKYPVVVWIHGGAFSHGYSSEEEFDGAPYAKNGVVFVSIAYRLGAFGFLNSGNGECNFGLLDQLAALQWIKDNISAFGGDSHNVTVMGQSAGAISTELLLESPQNKQMFSKAILQSGAGLSSNPLLVSSKQEAAQLYQQLLELTNSNNLDELKKKSASEILEASQKVKSNTLGVAFRPIADNKFILKNSEERQTQLKSQHVKAIMGVTKDDLFSEDKDTDNKLLKIVEQFANQLGTKDSYVYVFEHELPGSNDGAFHSSELWYTFGTLNRCWRPMTKEDEDLSHEMLGYWTNFIKNGDPNDSNLPKWNSYDTGQVLKFE